MVRTYRIAPSPWNPRPDARTVNKFDSPPTCGLFTKVSQRPTNHSKFTGKCGRARRNDDDDDNANDEDQDVMGYYDVAFDQVNEEDEGWCLLGEI
ncbi:hypothetical protein CUMW_111320 [Citrus unshiu]|nr:hypothetical protein CUMW_111320 [Citrus unshiu]